MHIDGGRGGIAHPVLTRASILFSPYPLQSPNEPIRLGKVVISKFGINMLEPPIAGIWNGLRSNIQTSESWGYPTQTQTLCLVVVTGSWNPYPQTARLDSAG